MKVIILAGGKGTRMEHDGPKVLVNLNNRPMIHYVLDTVLKSGVDPNPTVVVGYQQELVRESLKDYPVNFVYQAEQLGTGHAVIMCNNSLDPNENVMVLYGDHPNISKELLLELVGAFKNNETAIAMVTYKVDDFEKFGGAFKSFGRIIRNKDNQIMAICEAKDLKPEQENLNEVNPAYYAFKGPWIWNALEKISNNNSQNEYYLTDLVDIAFKENLLITGIKRTKLLEAIGVNTKEQLSRLTFNLS